MRCGKWAATRDNRAKECHRRVWSAIDCVDRARDVLRRCEGRDAAWWRGICDALKQAAGEEGAAKLDRAPTLVAASVVQTGDEVQDEEDVSASAAAVYIVLLAAHARGLVGYWRTPGVVRTDAGREALGLGPAERVLGLIHLGPQRQEKEPPERLPPSDYVTYLA